MLGLSRLFDVDQRVEDMFQNVFEKRNCLLFFINAGALIQFLVSLTQKSWPVYNVADKNDFKVVLASLTFKFLVFFHTLCLLNNQKKGMNVKVSYKIGMGVAFVIQKVL